MTDTTSISLPVFGRALAKGTAPYRQLRLGSFSIGDPMASGQDTQASAGCQHHEGNMQSSEALSPAKGFSKCPQRGILTKTSWYHQDTLILTRSHQFLSGYNVPRNTPQCL